MARGHPPSRGFVLMKCPDCTNEQIVFTKAASLVVCQVCGSTLATPSGGVTQVRGEILKAVD